MPVIDQIQRVNIYALSSDLNICKWVTKNHMGKSTQVLPASAYVLSTDYYYYYQF